MTQELGFWNVLTGLRSLTRECATRGRAHGVSDSASRAWRAETSSSVRACENACVIARVRVHSAHVDDQRRSAIVKVDF